MKDEMLFVERLLVEEEDNLKGYSVLQSIYYWFLSSICFSSICCFVHCLGIAWGLQHCLEV